MQDSITESKTINYILFMYFADVAAYLLKKEVEHKSNQFKFINIYFMMYLTILI